MAEHGAYGGSKPPFRKKVFNDEVPVYGGVILREKPLDHESDFPGLLSFIYKILCLFINFLPQQLCSGQFSLFRKIMIGSYFLKKKRCAHLLVSECCNRIFPNLI